MVETKRLHLRQRVYALVRRVMVLSGVESGVVRILTSSDICVGRFTSEVFLICNKYHEVKPPRFFTYKSEVHDG